MENFPESNNGIGLDEVVVCLHQVYRIRDNYRASKDVGDCSKCVYDLKNNPACTDYHPVKIYYFEVK